MPTTLQAFDQPVRGFLKNMAKRKAIGNSLRFAVHGRSRDWTVLARRMVARTVRAAGFSTSLGTLLGVGTNGLWGRLEEVPRLLGEVRQQAPPCLTNGEICRQQYQRNV